METIWAIDTNLILTKPNIQKHLSHNELVFDGPLRKMKEIISKSTFPDDQSFVFVIPHFVFEEVKNQCQLGLESYVKELQLMNQELLRPNWEKTIRKELQKQISAFKKEYKILNKPSPSKIAKWTKEFFTRCGFDGINSSDAKDFIIGKEVEDDSILFLITNNTKDFVQAFKSFSAIRIDTAMGDLNSLVMANDTKELINQFFSKEEMNYKDDLVDHADSELIDWKVLSYEKSELNKNGFIIRTAALYKNSYYLSQQQILENQEAFPNMSSVIIIFEIDDNKIKDWEEE